MSEPTKPKSEKVDPADLEIDDDTVIICCCGAKGTYDQLFDNSAIDTRCGGSGALSCHCGGDLCVCHNHGEVECFGCPDCEPEDDFDDERDDD